jgi:ferredoxin
MKAVVDEDRCRGHGVCWSLCPQVFTLTDDGYAVASPDEVPDEHVELVRQAVANCPEHAITTT